MPTELPVSGRSGSPVVETPELTTTALAAMGAAIRHAAKTALKNELRIGPYSLQSIANSYHCPSGMSKTFDGIFAHSAQI
ncbi:hypothetical protein LNKW23_47780 [Paralimibaculum aggregatum]|uniref:Uncharacterized protein n=1 Tax=Paralimibaculum aggregatum TaxID=3036245 RepID=A0ABQ6LTZ5_9RHOB|nr:hypothetical protein LNKW23_47780 [Limibaculum sp. NKW23]